ncbi:MAG: LuxR C-terminal-related transcriptional regulator [Panacagrimonas sp.]
MPRRAKPTTDAPVAERKVGRTDPPVFMFRALRRKVLDRIQAPGGLASKCVAVMAPVGYGKTVLMSMLLSDLRRTGRQCLWFALDDRDATLDSLIGGLESLLRESDTTLHPTHALFRGHEPAEKRIDALIELIAGYPLPMTLFIDNLQFCSDPALGRLLDWLCFRTQATVHLVLSSTREMPLDVARAELEGLIRQIGPADLGFGSDEVGELLGPELCQRIGLQGLEAVTRQTEGWPAAARMVQIILSNAEDPRATLKTFSGSDQALAKLLNRQVLSGFPAEIRDFLLCLAQLRTFCLELCTQAIGGDRAAEHLAYLMERNVFVIPIDRNREWYRLHGLFRDHLLHDAGRALAAGRSNDVLTRAARWCESNGYWREAIEYALASGSASTASEVLERTAATFVRDRGDILQYIGWLEALHGQGHQAGPEAEYWFGWALAFHRRYDYARQQIDILAERIRRPSGKLAVAPDLQRRITILRTSIDSLTDHLQDAHRGASEWLAGASTSGDDAFNLTAAHCIESCYFTNALQFVDARRAIQSARESAFQANSAYVDGWVHSYSGLIEIHEGNYVAAYPELVRALDTTRAALGDESGICGTLAMVVSRCAIGMGLVQEACQLLELGLRTSRTHGFLEATACGLDAALLLWTGASDDPISIASLREVASAYPPRLSFTLSCHLIRRLIRLGRIDEARTEASRIGLNIETGQRRKSICPFAGIAQIDALMSAVRIELNIAAGRYKQGEAVIEQERRRAKASDCIARLVELELDSAEVAARIDDRALSVRHITRAVRLGAPRRILRIFHDHAATLGEVVSQTKASAWGFASEEERRFFAELCRTLPGSDLNEVARVATAHDQPRLLGSLTAREMELLGFIDAGLSNQQLADRTDVSLTTIKWHLQNLYGKLAVSSRSAALAKARMLNLLPR